MSKSVRVEHGLECVIGIGTIKTHLLCADSLAILPLKQVNACMHEIIAILQIIIVLLKLFFLFFVSTAYASETQNSHIGFVPSTNAYNCIGNESSLLNCNYVSDQSCQRDHSVGLYRIINIFCRGNLAGIIKYTIPYLSVGYISFF